MATPPMAAHTAHGHGSLSSTLHLPLRVVPSLLTVACARLCVWCRYAKDNELFRKDFAAAFQKLEELGTKNLKPVAL